MAAGSTLSGAAGFDLLALPTDCLLHALAFLDAGSLRAAGSTCAALRRLALVPARALVHRHHAPAFARLQREGGAKDRDWLGVLMRLERTEANWRTGRFSATRAEPMAGHSGRIFGVQLFEEDYVISAADNNETRVWDKRTRECRTCLVTQKDGDKNFAAFDVYVDPYRPRSFYLPSFAGTVICVEMDVDAERKLGAFSRSELQQMALESNGTFDAAAATKDELVKRIVYDGGAPIVKRHAFQAHVDPIVTVRTDGRKLVSCSFDNTFKLWDIADVWDASTAEKHCVQTYKAHPGAVNSAAWDGKQIASVCTSGVVCLWDPERTEPLRRIDNAHTSWIWSVTQLRPFTTTYFTGSVDKTLKMWDMRLDDPLVNTLSFGGPVSGNNVRYNESRLVTTSFDNIISVFDLRYVAPPTWFEWPTLGGRRPEPQALLRIPSGLDRNSRSATSDCEIAVGGFCGRLKVFNFEGEETAAVAPT